VLGIPTVHEIADHSPQPAVDFINQGPDYLPGRAEEPSQKALKKFHDSAQTQAISQIDSHDCAVGESLKTTNSLESINAS